MLFALFLTIIVSSSAVLASDCNLSSCKIPKHYDEFGCTPVFKSGECCPSSFDCSSLTSRNENNCYYKNKVFNIGDTLEDEDIEGSCTVSCFCERRNADKPAKFTCAHIDCPEFFGHHDSSRLGKKCIAQYGRKSCCKARDVCGQDIEKLAKCEFEGHTYYEGERIDTGRSCYSCLCEKGFENKPYAENKHCNKVECNIEVHYSAKINQGCIPIFYKSDECCPIQWRCPSDADAVIPDKKRTDIDSDLKCSFGKLKMSLGDSLSPEENSNDQCTICSCIFPPMPYCIKTC